jgi:Protein tyrosine and serine/threonine kinase
LSKGFDTWSFATCVWEILSGGKIPYADLAKNAEVVSFVTGGGRLPRIDPSAQIQCADEMYTLLLKCWDEKRQARPAFVHVVRELTGMMQKFDDAHEVSRASLDASDESSDDESSEVTGSASESSTPTPLSDAGHTYSTRFADFDTYYTTPLD